MKKGEKVHWKWGRYEAEGKVEKKFEKTVALKIKGSQIKRKASKKEPAYLLRQNDGNAVLRSESELKKGRKYSN